MITQLALTTVLAPLLGCIIAGFFRHQVGRVGAHTVTILGVFVAFISALLIAKALYLDAAPAVNQNLYTWASGATLFPYSFNIGFLVDKLTVLMMLVVTFVSLLVHVYSIGYMHDDAGYQRFFSYISLFTFCMLMLVSANNFLQLFFGWEGVGLVSYLLIGFWYTKESANQGSMKAFLVNRVGDFGFILGIAVVLAYTGSIDYQQVFAKTTLLSQQSTHLLGMDFSIVTLICLLLFVGAMGKSAQVPLHVWLPESMEGPTPISALIHAATMVTAGVFMVARMSPLFELSETALSFVMVIGATGALFTGILALVMFDIKRVVAYSTLSQLGYMMVAMGASAYSAGVFHLTTHACFKAVLFLGAGSVIIALHHEQDMRKMGGLAKYMPITYATCLVASLALVALPPFAGFYSKDIIIEAAGLSTIWGARYAYYCVAIGAFVTALYTFRAFFMTFHGKPRFHGEAKESPWVVTMPLVLLAIPSMILGFLLVEPMLFSKPNLLGDAIMVQPQHDVLSKIGHEFHGAFAMAMHAFTSPIFYLTLAGIACAAYAYLIQPTLPAVMAKRFSIIYKILVNKYGFDSFNQAVFVRGARGVGELLFSLGDKRIIDGFFVNGSGVAVQWLSRIGRRSQSGYLYHYATTMVIGLLMLLYWLVNV